MPLTTNQRNTVRTAIVTWATTNRPELLDSTARTAFANALLDYADLHRSEAIRSGDSQGRHYFATLRALLARVGLNATVMTACDNHCEGL